FVNYAATAFTPASPAGDCRAVQVPLAIDANSFVRLASIRATGETVKHGLYPATRCGAELKNRATPMVAAEHCRAIDIPRAVRLQIGVSVFAVVLFKTKDDICRRRGSGYERQRDNE